MENTINYKYLKFIGFSKLSYWDVKRLTFNNSFSSAHKMVKLEKILTPISEKIRKNEYDGTLKVIAKISFNEGKIYLREKGETGMDLYKLYAGDLLVSNINFHQGALAINNFGEDLVCSTHYQPYRINEELVDKEFLVILLRSEKFKNYVVNQKSNGIKTESKYSFIKELEIPLPDTLEEQRKIIQSYKADLKNALIAKNKAINIEKEIEDYLVKELGIEKNSVKNKKGKIYFVDFKKLDRWDAGFFSGSLSNLESKFIIKKFSSIIRNLNKGTKGESIRINSINHPNQDFKYIGMEHIEKETGTLLELLDVKGKDIKSQTLNVPKGYLLFGKLRPYLNKYWLNTTDFGNIICSSEFLVFDTKDEIINKNYFKYCLSSNFIQYQINDKTSGARMPRINENIFNSLQVPLPSLEIQALIVENIEKLKENSLKLKNEVDNLLKNSMVHFEKQIFNS